MIIGLNPQSKLRGRWVDGLREGSVRYAHFLEFHVDMAFWFDLWSHEF
ncbi:hypothetical protein SLEP1_g32262 [Rubroshorea leprosula]|uniref:Uncharacterized protein n=1 Tax=Rubroshorea leprosula TaxID=152421 RepID=A0AAV5KCQ3_9ROSI|nr:hypothetical protein SLEP1_g32262 [Rubroshorea leprosula]